MESNPSRGKYRRTCGFYYWQILLLVPLALTVHYVKMLFFDKVEFLNYYKQTGLDVSGDSRTQCTHLFYETVLLQQQINELKGKLQELEAWKSEFSLSVDSRIEENLEKFYSDQIGLFDYASEHVGGSIISTPHTMSGPSMFVMKILGSFSWAYESQPSLILHSPTLPGQCYAFYGGQGRIRVKLAHPVMVTHVSLEHVRIGDTLKSAPRDFQVLGLTENFQAESLGNFTYDLDDKIIQTFPTALRKKFYASVELRVMSNHGNKEFTCVYRFRVHSLFD